MRSLRPLPLALLVAGVGCDWIALAANAARYPTSDGSAAINVVAHPQEDVAYAALSERGIGVVDLESGRVIDTIAPAPGSESVDDLALDGDVLLALDARPPGRLTAYSLHDRRRPMPASGPHAVPVGPFSGVSASQGTAVVSGGTSEMTVWRYDSAGWLSATSVRGDLGRGQPDVLLDDRGIAVVSTHYRGPRFGVELARFDIARGAIARLAGIALDGAGFTAGGSHPANFPIQAASVGDGTLLIAFGRGVAVIDAVDPAAPRLVTTIDAGGPAVHVDARGTSAVVTVAGAVPAVAFLERGDDRVWRVERRLALAAGTIPAGVTFTLRHVVIAARDRGVLVVRR